MYNPYFNQTFIIQF